HTAIGLHRSGGVPEAARMHRPSDRGLSSRCRDHLVDGEAGEGLAAFAGEDVGPFGLLITLQSFEAIGLVALEVMGAVDRAFEAPDSDRALAPVNVVPA